MNSVGVGASGGRTGGRESDRGVVFLSTDFVIPHPVLSAPASPPPGRSAGSSPTAGYAPLPSPTVFPDIPISQLVPTLPAGFFLPAPTPVIPPSFDPGFVAV